MRAIVVFMVALGLAGCRGASVEGPCEEDMGCVRYAIAAGIPILDPHIAEEAEAGIIFRQIYDTLVYRDRRSHEFLPGLAESWEVSADGLAYTFRLRDGVVFHDGGPFRAASVAANLERVMDPATGSARARRLLGPYSHYEILDAYQIVIHLHAPFAPLLDSLSQPFLGIASERALANYNRLRYQFHQSGTGPFRLSSYLPGERVELRRWEGYDGSLGIYGSLNDRAVNRVEFHIIDGQGSAGGQILGGGYDIVDDIGPSEAASLVGNSAVQILPIAIPGQAGQFLFNTRREHIDKQEVRVALVLASNRVAMADGIFFNYSPVAWAPLSRATGYSHTGYVNAYAYDLGLAQELLALAGYGDGDGDGVLEGEGGPLELSMLVPPWGELPAVGDYLREQWRQIGVALTVDSVPGVMSLREGMLSGKYDLFPIDNYGIDPGLLNEVFLDGGEYGASRAEDGELSEMLLGALGERDASVRRNRYYEIQSHMMVNALILPIREYVRIRGAGEGVRGLRYDAYGFYPLLHEVWLEG